MLISSQHGDRKKPRVFDKICQEIRKNIAAKQLKPGDRLPSERVLAAQFNVGRPAVREALRTLEQAGIVKFDAGKNAGAFICDGDTAALSQSVCDLLLLGRFTIQELYAFRTMVLEITVRTACARATENDFHALDECANQSQPLKSRTSADNDLLKLIARAAHNQLLCICVNLLIETLMFPQKEVAQNEGFNDLRQSLVNSMRLRNPERSLEDLSNYIDAIHAMRTEVNRPD